MKQQFIYGINSVTSLLKNSPEQVIEILLLDSKNNRKNNIIDSARNCGININNVSKQQLDKLLPDAVHQGVAAKVKSKGLISEQDFFAMKDIFGDDADGKNLILVLDHIQDPHNLGAILRSANAAGVAAVVITKDKSAKITSTVSKVASGAAELTTIVAVNNLARFMEKLKDNNFWTVGACMDAGSTSLYKFDSKNINNLALVMGAEGDGLRDLTKKHCDFLVHIPMYGAVESLNVSVATGIMLFEMKKLINN